MCGEKSENFDEVSTEEGSPPHVRGKGVDVLAVLLTDRITPACAGKRLPAPHEGAC